MDFASTYAAGDASPSGEPARTKATAVETDETFAKLQRDLAQFNRHRLMPAMATHDWQDALGEEFLMRRREGAFVESERRRIAADLATVPSDAATFVGWFEALRATGPGQKDPLFPWLATRATRDEFVWFLTQEVAGEAGFEDLVALTQIKMPVRAKLEMARNYWDEMGQGNVKGMHGPMLDRLAKSFDIAPTIGTTVTEALALGNMMVALATNRRYAYQSIGALGIIELTAPGRAELVNAGLRRLGVAPQQRHYFALHATLDVRHAVAWNAEVLHDLVAEDPTRARAIAEGALLRLSCGARCFARYRTHFGAEAFN